MDPLALIEDITAHEKRGPGTDAERRTANDLQRILERELDRDATIESTAVRPNYAFTHLIHAAAVIGGGLLSTAQPLAGLLIVLIAAVSAFGDLTGQFPLARLLTPRRASQNVISRDDRDRPGTLILVAHYDAAKSGAAFSPRARARRERIGKTFLRRPLGPFEPFFVSIMAVLLCCAVRLLGVEGLALNAVQFIPTIVLIVAVPLLVDIALSDTVPGASDNASGVATVLRLAERYGERLDHFNLDVLLTGAGEGMHLGMSAFLKRHKKELSTENTVFVCIDDVGGGGGIRYATKEGWILGYPYHPDLIALADQIKAEDDEERPPAYEADPENTRTATDAHRARTAGYPAIAISTADQPHYHQPTDTPDNIDEDSLTRAYDFCSELIELIDETIGPRLRTGARGKKAAR